MDWRIREKKGSGVEPTLNVIGAVGLATNDVVTQQLPALVTLTALSVSVSFHVLGMLTLEFSSPLLLF